MLSAIYSKGWSCEQDSLGFNWQGYGHLHSSPEYGSTDAVAKLLSRVPRALRPGSMDRSQPSVAHVGAELWWWMAWFLDAVPSNGFVDVRDGLNGGVVIECCWATR